MRYAIMILALVGVLALPRPAAAITGNEFLERCEKKDKVNVGWFWCTGYVEGWAESQIISSAFAKAQKTGAMKWVCFPKGGKMLNTQLVDVLVKYLNNHPEARHQKTMILAHKAFSEAFPCPKN